MNQSLWRTLSEDGETITIKRFHGEIPTPSYATSEWFKSHPEQIGTGAVLDVETTGLSHHDDEVIEVGIRKFLFDRETGEVLKATEQLQQLGAPRAPISPEISRLTGLTNEDLVGKKIDWLSVDQFLKPVEFVVAHNAGFDRPFIDAKVSCSKDKLWLCSLSQVDWAQKGFAAQKLELLSIYHGFFNQSHRALSDVDSLLYLLSQKDLSSNTPYLKELVAKSTEASLQVLCYRSPFESKDFLKQRGYRWDALNKFWKKVIRKSSEAEEKSWLEEKVYLGPFLGSIREIPLRDQFKSEG